MSGMTDQLLTKGLEEEVYTGTPEGVIVGMAHRAKQALEGFKTEPDCRNTEFVSPPMRSYDDLGCNIMKQRRQLRDWLTTEGDYTIIPGATMSTGDSSYFHISDPQNKYYGYIRDTYFTRVVTASLHISMGLDDRETIMRASRLFRMEAALFLALTASSPFLDGRATGYHSQRWAQFPHTPTYVPLFENYDAYVQFIHDSIEKGDMQNSRHLWISARPNGDSVPHDINRIELRVCDRVDCPAKMLAVTALMEARLWQMLEDPSLDPLESSELPNSTRLDDLMAINDENNIAVMTNSLEADVRHWRDGRRMPVRQWLESYIADATKTAQARGFAGDLEPINGILTHGNPAMRWMAHYDRGVAVSTIIQQAIKEMEAAEQEHCARIC